MVSVRPRLMVFSLHCVVCRTKKIFTFLLNRTNTVNGKRYGDDPTVLAWETGNEMQHNYRGE